MTIFPEPYKLLRIKLSVLVIWVLTQTKGLLFSTGYKGCGKLLVIVVTITWIKTERCIRKTGKLRVEL
jgi:hypothetical protein